jgi:hypothetical protein
MTANEFFTTIASLAALLLAVGILATRRKLTVAHKVNREEMQRRNRNK